MATRSTVKSAARVELGRAQMAKAPRDPVTGRLLKRAADHPAASPSADPSPPPPAGGDAPASSPFRGRLLTRHRRTSGF